MIILDKKSWVCTREQYDARPEGTISAILNANSGHYGGDFDGKITVATRGDNQTDLQLMSIGWLDAPELYPNGTPVIDPTAEEPSWDVFTITDPCSEKTNEEILFSATYRGLI
jgi:hypothetical protein